MPGPLELSARKQEKLRRRWRGMHAAKRAYPSRRRARRAIIALIRDDIARRTLRRTDLRLCSYRCRWGDRWEDGASFPVHWHIGHGQGHGRRAWRRLRRWHPARRYLVYPWRRAASRVRIAVRTRSLARHPGWHKGRGRRGGPSDSRPALR